MPQVSNHNAGIHESRLAYRLDERRKQNRRATRVNKFWLWTGVIVLCFILLFWLFDIGTYIGPNQ